MTLTLPEIPSLVGVGHLLGLVGTGIGPSLTPALHEREGDAQGMRTLYRRLDLDALELAADDVGRVLDAARLTGFSGLNVTHPAKQTVLRHLDRIDPDAAALGAVNTVVFGPHGAIGHNTDRSGFARSFRRGLPGAAVDRVLLLGAGGAGAAVAHAMTDVGVGELLVADADRARAEALAAAVRETGRATTAVVAKADVEDALATVDGLVHATPTGMAAHPGTPVAPHALHERLWVADVVYRPLATALVTAARARGARVLDGGGMAVFQAVDAFRLFTGVEPDADRMLDHFAGLVAAGA
ncbi:shikimate dehydrogenase [Actinomycetospora sp. Odt1-22]|uniref:Shikimate dehydrogenase n=1 Tax=Actinomycetospora termitidis TaxID=3053470 RepID=A0ABT7M6G2_9PSEU|nr:shikimate dehydrogenase [Actinomycetospora sp. Odt1-22]MDL5156261.1 shikimate dehydrogenase [Actinomycetospora sp. Odt1-22]